MIRKILITLMLAGMFSANAQVEVFDGFILDTLTTEQLDALPAKVKIKGAHFYNKDVGSLVSWDGAAWVAIGGTIPDGSITEAKLNTSVNASLDLADSSVQPADLSDYVDKTSNETIGGIKTFTGRIYIDSDVANDSRLAFDYVGGATVNIAQSQNGSMYFENDRDFVINNGNTASQTISFGWDSNTARRDYILPNASGTIALTSDIGASGDLWSDPVDANIVPDGVTRDLGSSTNYFSDFYSDNIRGYTPNPIIDMRDTDNTNNEGFRFGPTANGQDFLLEFLDDLNGVTATYTINSSGTPSVATDLVNKAAMDAAISGSGAVPDDTGSSDRDVLTTDGAGTYTWEKISATQINPNVSDTEFGYLDGLGSSIQTQLTDKLSISAGNQIASRPEKISPVSTDILLLEDSENSFTKRRVQIGNLPGGASSNVSVQSESGETIVDVRIGTTSYLNGLSAPPSGTAALEFPTDATEPAEIQIACSDLTTDITTGTTKAYFRMPYAMTLTEVRVSLLTAGTGTGITIDINESGTTVLSTKLTTDATEKTSETATTAAVISDSALADDAEITIDFDAVPTNGQGVIVTLIGTRA